MRRLSLIWLGVAIALGTVLEVAGYFHQARELDAFAHQSAGLIGAQLLAVILLGSSAPVSLVWGLVLLGRRPRLDALGFFGVTAVAVLALVVHFWVNPRFPGVLLPR